MAKGQVGIVARQCVFEFPEPAVYQWLMKEVFAEGERMGMSKAAIFVEGMREVFFIPGQEIENGGEDVEGKIALGWKKSFLILKWKTLDWYGMDARFKNNGGRGFEVEAAGDVLRRIIDPGAGGCGEC